MNLPDERKFLLVVLLGTSFLLIFIIFQTQCTVEQGRAAGTREEQPAVGREVQKRGADEQG